MSERINTVAITSPGDMGHAIGRVLKAQGLDVITCLEGRSTRTQGLARQAGLREVDSLQDVVHQADLVLSILVPCEAEAAATAFATAMDECGRATHYVDCNAIALQTAQRINQAIVTSGGIFTDASLIGFPPGTGTPPRLYVSGPHAEMIRFLDGPGMAVKHIGPQIGQASGIKMCYAAMTKGTFALHYALTMAASRLNLLDDLLSEFEFSQPEAFQQMHEHLPRLPAKASRWVGEMEQIAATFESLQVTPFFHQGAAEIYDLIRQTPSGKETPETIDHSRSLESTIAEILKQSET